MTKYPETQHLMLSKPTVHSKGAAPFSARIASSRKDGVTSNAAAAHDDVRRISCFAHIQILRTFPKRNAMPPVSILSPVTPSPIRNIHLIQTHSN